MSGHPRRKSQPQVSARLTKRRLLLELAVLQNGVRLRFLPRSPKVAALFTCLSQRGTFLSDFCVHLHQRTSWYMFRATVFHIGALKRSSFCCAFEVNGHWMLDPPPPPQTSRNTLDTLIIPKWAKTFARPASLSSAYKILISERSPLKEPSAQPIYRSQCGQISKISRAHDDQILGPSEPTLARWHSLALVCSTW